MSPAISASRLPLPQSARSLSRQTPRSLGPVSPSFPSAQSVLSKKGRRWIRRGGSRSTRDPARRPRVPARMKRRSSSRRFAQSRRRRQAASSASSLVSYAACCLRSIQFKHLDLSLGFRAAVAARFLLNLALYLLGALHGVNSVHISLKYDTKKA